MSKAQSGHRWRFLGFAWGVDGDFEPGASALRLISSAWLVWVGGGWGLVAERLAMLVEDVEGVEDGKAVVGGLI